MLDPQKHIESLENLLPPASGRVFAAAAQQVLASGQSLLQSQDGAIYEIFPDGHRQFVKFIEPPISVIPGSTIIIQ